MQSSPDIDKVIKEQRKIANEMHQASIYSQLRADRMTGSQSPYETYMNEATSNDYPVYGPYPHRSESHLPSYGSPLSKYLPQNGFPSGLLNTPPSYGGQQSRSFNNVGASSFPEKDSFARQNFDIPRQRGPKTAVAEDKKDEAYVEKRTKNNASARISRLKKKKQDELTTEHLRFLEGQNNESTHELSRLLATKKFLEAAVLAVQNKNFSQYDATRTS